MLKKTLIFALASTSLLLGCGDDDDAAATQDVTINFAALVGGAPFACDGSYTMGAMDTPATLTELKFYVSEVTLMDGDKEVPVELANDGKWQNGTVALLDFEDGSGGCANGTPDLNSTVVGTVPAGDYTGLSFTLGVPFEENHQDSAVADSPLNLTQMFWNWQGGYKFLRLDGMAGETGGFRVHLGSTGCQMGDNTTDVSSCAKPNRPRYTFNEFTQDQTVTLNVERLFEDEDMTPNAEGNSTICMSNPDHAPCNSVFEKLGLKFGENTPAEQQIFSVE